MIQGITIKDLKYSNDIRLNELIQCINNAMLQRAHIILREKEFKYPVSETYTTDEEIKHVQKVFEDTGEWRVTVQETGKEIKTRNFIFEVK